MISLTYCGLPFKRRPPGAAHQQARVRHDSLRGRPHSGDEVGGSNPPEKLWKASVPSQKSVHPGGKRSWRWEHKEDDVLAGFFLNSRGVVPQRGKITVPWQVLRLLSG